MRLFAAPRSTATRENAIRVLAIETRRPIDEVAAIYDERLAALEREARVKDFVSVLAFRETREQLLRH